MTKRDLIERIEAYQDDTVLLAFNLPVMGFLYTPPHAPLDENDQRKSYTPPTLEFYT